MDKNGITQVKWSDPTAPAVTDGNNVHHIILDCTNVTFIDTVGAKTIKQLVEDCNSIYITVLLARVNGE